MFFTKSSRVTPFLHPFVTLQKHVTAFELAGLSQYASYSKALVYDTPGEPLDVLRLQDYAVPNKPAEDGVIVRYLAAPINPSDINTVQGKYPLRPQLPGGIPGHEGVAEVVQVGPQVHGLSPGDWVVPARSALGTWRSYAALAAEDFTRLPQGLSMQQAAVISINPPTALGMLESFVQLQPGDVVIQNGATSAVGQAVIQLAKAKGLHTVNLVRDRPNMDETRAQLTALGADVVTSESELSANLKRCGLPPPALALNCVGGSAALAVAKHLRPGGVMVTYGGMSLQPLTLPVGLLIFKDISFRGFWVSGRWSQQLGPDGRASVLARCAGYMQQGLLTPQFREYPMEQWRQAFEEAVKPHKGVKVLLTFGQQ